MSLSPATGRPDSKVKAPPAGSRVLAVFGLGEERVLDAAVGAAERGRGRLIVASCPNAQVPTVGAFVSADCGAVWRAEDLRAKAFARAIETIPGTLPVLTVCCEHTFVASLRRLVAATLPDLAFVATRRQERRVRRLGLSDVVVVSRRENRYSPIESGNSR